MLTLISCGEDVQFNNESVLQGVRNNEFWQGTGAQALATPSVLILSAMNGTETITLRVPLPGRTIDPKKENTFMTFVLGESANKKATYTVEDANGELVYETRLGEEDGEVVISEFDGNVVSGTFRFNAYNIDEDADEDDLVNLQEGVFYKVAVIPSL